MADLRQGWVEQSSADGVTVDVHLDGEVYEDVLCIGTPPEDGEAVMLLQQGDDLIALSDLGGGTSGGGLTIAEVQQLIDAALPDSVLTTAEVQQLIDAAPYVLRSGDSMTGNLSIPAGTDPTHAVNKGQLDGKAPLVHAHPISQVTGLQTALDAKADDSAVVHLAGVETITANKKFSVSPDVPPPAGATSAVPRSYVDDMVKAFAGGISLVGSYDAAAHKVAALTANAGSGIVLGQPLPVASAANKGMYLIITVTGTATAADNVKPNGTALEVGDWVVSDGQEWLAVDMSASAKEVWFEGLDPYGTKPGYILGDVWIDTGTLRAYVNDGTGSKPLATTIANVTGLQTVLDAKTPSTRKLTTTAPLTGGGDLTADRVLGISTGTTANTVAAGNHLHDGRYLLLSSTASQPVASPLEVRDRNAYPHARLEIANNEVVIESNFKGDNFDRSLLSLTPTEARLVTLGKIELFGVTASLGSSGAGLNMDATSGAMTGPTVGGTTPALRVFSASGKAYARMDVGSSIVQVEAAGVTVKGGTSIEGNTVVTGTLTSTSTVRGGALNTSGGLYVGGAGSVPGAINSATCWLGVSSAGTVYINGSNTDSLTIKNLATAASAAEFLRITSGGVVRKSANVAREDLEDSVQDDLRAARTTSDRIAALEDKIAQLESVIEALTGNGETDG